jgi:MoxR-like ATPase
MQASLSHDKLSRVNQLARAITDEVGRAFIGSPTITEALLTALLARGHVLIEGYPGVAKTTLVKAFSATLGCGFRRIQFTPDLLPSDTPRLCPSRPLAGRSQGRADARGESRQDSSRSRALAPRAEDTREDLRVLLDCRGAEPG